MKVKIGGELVEVKLIKNSVPKELLCTISTGEVLGLDIETSPLPQFVDHEKAGLNPRLSRISTIQVYSESLGTCFVFQLNTIPNWREVLGPFLEQNQFVAHYANFEYRHFYHAGIELPNMGCSMMLAKTYFCAVTPQGLQSASNLAYLSAKILKFEMSKDEQVSAWGDEELTDSQVQYAALDAIACLMVSKKVVAAIKRRGITSILKSYKLNKAALPAIAKMMYHGMYLDIDPHDELISEWDAEYEEVRAELSEIIPKGLNLKSPKQMHEWLSEELGATKKGRAILSSWPTAKKTKYLKCDKLTLPLYAHLPVVKPLLRYKLVGNKISTYGRTLQALRCPVTGRIHGSYTQCSTDTGRMSSFSPNVQNFPRGNFRKIFSAPAGRVLVGADFSQIEVRVAAHLSGDKDLLKSYEEYGDAYIYVASKMFGKPTEAVTPKERQYAKPVLLGRIFGLGAKTLASRAGVEYGVEMTPEEAKDFLEDIDKYFPTLCKWKNKTTSKAETTLISKTIGGKIRKLPEDTYYCKSLNTPVQGTAAEILLHSLIKLDKALGQKKKDILPVSTTHDDIVLECLEEDAPVASEILEESMKKGMLEIFPTAFVDNLVDVKIGNNWVEIK